MRDNKGYRWEKHFNDYTVIDLETCGLLGEDRNSIIELSAIKVRDGIVVDEYSSLVNPIALIIETLELDVSFMEKTGTYEQEK